MPEDQPDNSDPGPLGTPDEKLQRDAGTESDSLDNSSPGPSGLCSTESKVPKDHPDKSDPGPSGVPSATSASSIMPSSCSVSLLSSKVVSPTPPAKLTDKEKEAIDRVFANKISSRKKVIMEEVQRKCCTTAVLSSLALSKKRVKQIVNYVNNPIDKQPTTDPKDLPKQTTSRTQSWLEEFDEPSTRSSGRRDAWDEKDCQILERRLEGFTSLPSTYQIKDMFRDDDELSRILDKERWPRTYNKIKNIFKKCKRNNTGS